MATQPMHPLRLERKRKRLTQKVLADLTGLGEATIERAEGGARVSLDTQQRLCAFFHKTPEELGLEGAAVIPDHEASRDALSAPAAPEELSRRQALKLFGAGGMGLLTTATTLTAGPLWEQVVRALARPSQLDPTALAHLESITQSYWQLSTTMSSPALLDGVRGHFLTVTRLLQQPLLPQMRQQVCAVAAQVAQLLGQITFEVHDLEASRAYYKVATDAAAEADRPELEATALGRISLLFTEHVLPERTLVLLGRAQRAAQQAGSAYTSAWLSAIEAEAHATSGDAQRCLAALADAEQALTRGRQETDTSWTEFSQARFLGYQGICFLQLQRPQEAIAALRAALTVQPSPAPHARAIILSDLASAYMAAGEVEEGCRLASETLTLAKELGSEAVLQRLQRMRQRLNKGEATMPEVQQLDEELLLA